MKKNKPLKLLIVDDHKIMREILAEVLHSHPEITIIHEASDGLQAIDMTKKIQYDIIIIDINMPNLDGIETTQNILKRSRDVMILVLSMHARTEYIRKLVKAGVKGYVLKSCGLKEIRDAISALIRGETYFCNDVVSIAMNNIIIPKEQPHLEKIMVSKISKREKQVLEMITQGLTNKEIANELSLSHRTVDAHRRNLLLKTEVKNTAGLVKFAFINKLVD